MAKILIIIILYVDLKAKTKSPIIMFSLQILKLTIIQWNLENVVSPLH